MPRMQYSLITETFSLESKTVFKKPTLCQQILGTGRMGGEGNEDRHGTHNTTGDTNKQKFSLTQRQFLVGSPESPAKK